MGPFQDHIHIHESFFKAALLIKGGITRSHISVNDNFGEIYHSKKVVAYVQMSIIDVEKCTKMLKNVQKSLESQERHFQKCTEMFKQRTKKFKSPEMHVQKCTKMLKNVEKCPKMHKNVQCPILPALSHSLSNTLGFDWHYISVISTLCTF